MSSTEQNQQISQAFRQRPRKAGSLIAVMGGLLTYHSLVDPVRCAQAGATTVRLSLLGTVLGSFLLCLGLCYALGGARFARIFHPEPGKSGLPALIISAILGLIGLGLYFLAKSYLKTLGYG